VYSCAGSPECAELAIGPESGMADSITTAFVPESKCLYFIFGGIQGGVGMPPYEFYRSASVLDANKVFLRDLAQAWYQHGIPELGQSLSDIDAYLVSVIKRVQATKVRFVGNSMGGFAALLFCARTRHGSAIAFAPQTFISPELRATHGDNRWPVQMNQLHRSLTGKETLDLRQIVLGSHPTLAARIYVARDDRLDMIHAHYLADCPNVCVHEVDVGGHALVTALRDSGKLIEILNA